MPRRLLATLLTSVTLLTVLLWSRGDRPADRPTLANLPKSLGAVHPRLSPDGDTIAFSCQGEIWTAQRSGCRLRPPLLPRQLRSAFDEREHPLAFRADGPGTVDTATASLNAHTNLVYIEADGVVHRSAEEARAFLKWIDQFEILLRARNRFPTAKLPEQAQEQLEAARGVYRRIVREGR